MCCLSLVDVCCLVFGMCWLLRFACRLLFVVDGGCVSLFVASRLVLLSLLLPVVCCCCSWLSVANCSFCVVCCCLLYVV